MLYQETLLLLLQENSMIVKWCLKTEEKKKECAHWVWHSGTRLIWSPWQQWRWEGGTGDPLAFRPGIICRGPAVLTSVTSLLLVGQILEYQWSDCVPLVELLKCVCLLEAVTVHAGFSWPTSSLSGLLEQKYSTTPKSACRSFCYHFKLLIFWGIFKWGIFQWENKNIVCINNSIISQTNKSCFHLWC